LYAELYITQFKGQEERDAVHLRTG
jgi:hypothetical protein